MGLAKCQIYAPLVENSRYLPQLMPITNKLAMEHHQIGNPLISSRHKQYLAVILSDFEGMYWAMRAGYSVSMAIS